MCTAGLPGNHRISRPQEAYVRQAVDFIEMNYSQKISIAEVANHIGIERKYLSTLFNDVLHTSPQTFLVTFRMKKACTLLHNQRLSVSDVSRSVGYQDPLLFSKMFKKIFGLSPSAYRKRCS
jgi:AraC family transcriptional regulator, arabinose operon regulatory protein